jgi:hypothetical protein
LCPEATPLPPPRAIFFKMASASAKCRRNPKSVMLSDSSVAKVRQNRYQICMVFTLFQHLQIFINKLLIFVHYTHIHVLFTKYC